MMRADAVMYFIRWRPLIGRAAFVSSHLDLFFRVALLQRSEIDRLCSVYYLSLIVIIFIAAVLRCYWSDGQNQFVQVTV